MLFRRAPFFKKACEGRPKNMSFEHYIRSGSKMLRMGYTTGSCAALATLGASRLLLQRTAGAEALREGAEGGSLSILTPKGIEVVLAPGEYEAGLSEDGSSAWCALKKDAGDDADATDGIVIRADVSLEGEAPSGSIIIDGGEGVGRVTKPGLDQPPGEAAINSVPRRMIREAAERACEEAGYSGGLSVLISAIGGEEIAKKTFNPVLGVEGGISIIGTSGIVEPMSEQALIDTIAVNMRQARAESDSLIITPGNYGESFIESELSGLSELPQSEIKSLLSRPVVKCSNFIGEALDIAALEGFKELVLIAHAGKLVKVAAGVMNTHSRCADARLEVFAAHAAMLGAGKDVIIKLMHAATTDACIEILDSLCGKDFRKETVESIMDAVSEKLQRRAKGAYRTGALMFSNEYGLLGYRLKDIFDRR